MHISILLCAKFIKKPLFRVFFVQRHNFASQNLRYKSNELASPLQASLEGSLTRPGTYSRDCRSHFTSISYRDGFVPISRLSDHSKLLNLEPVPFDLLSCCQRKVKCVLPNLRKSRCRLANVILWRIGSICNIFDIYKTSSFEDVEKLRKEVIFHRKKRQKDSLY